MGIFKIWYIQYYSTDQITGYAHAAIQKLLLESGLYSIQYTIRGDDISCCIEVARTYKWSFLCWSGASADMFSVVISPYVVTALAISHTVHTTIVSNKQLSEVLLQSKQRHKNYYCHQLTQNILKLKLSLIVIKIKQFLKILQSCNYFHKI